jgi:tRNA(Leu) C34 or U34 (ribose-2'-O)-methylase TrmL
MRGWYGIALYEPKIEANLGIVCRSAHAFGAAFVACIGQRYRRVSTDTTKAGCSLPILYFPSWRECSETFTQVPIVTVEVNAGVPLASFAHPEQAIYVLGGEDRSVPFTGDCAVHIPTRYCLNLGSCATVVMYDRHAKM